MRRRALDNPATAAPEWVGTYDPADWRDPADELTEEFADLAALFGRAHRPRGPHPRPLDRRLPRLVRAARGDVEGRASTLA